MKSGYLGIWLILSVVLVALMLYALSDFEPAIFSWQPKKAPFRETLFADHATVEKKKASQDSILSERRKDENKKAAIDSTPQSILLIGDSMTLNLAYRLSQYAKRNGHQFHAVNWDSSNTKIWGESDTLRHYISEYKASYVFVSLGSNELYLTNPESHKKYVESILSQIGDLPYVWIGPPNWKEDAGLNDMIESTCRAGGFFRSAGMTFNRKKDGIHPTRESSALWIDSICRWIDKSAHPIVLASPSDTMGKVNPNVIFLKPKNK